MKDLLKLLTVALCVSVSYAEDVVKPGSAEAKPEATEVKSEADAKPAAKEENAEHKAAEHKADALTEGHVKAHEEPVAHQKVNRKEADKLTKWLAANQDPYSGPQSTIAEPACCKKEDKPAAQHAAQPAAAPKATKKKPAKKAKKNASHKEAKHDDKEAKHDDKEAKHDDKEAKHDNKEAKHDKKSDVASEEKTADKK